jgi:putative salt-induced outer membrane protein YdiY
MKAPIAILSCLCAALLTPTAVRAQAAAPEKPHWETTANGGLTLTRGNSHTILTTAGLDTKKKWESDEAALGVSGGYGNNSGVRNTDFVKAYGQYNRLVTERAFFGLNVQAEHDGIADLVYRARITPLVGYYLVKTAKTSLEFDAGPSCIIERYEVTPANAHPTTDTSLAVRFGEKFEHKITDTTKVWQTAEYVPAVNDWNNKYLINAEVGLSTSITPKWDLQVKLQFNHDSNPPSGKKYTDTRLIAGTGYRF